MATEEQLMRKRKYPASCVQFRAGPAARGYETYQFPFQTDALATKGLPFIVSCGSKDRRTPDEGKIRKQLVQEGCVYEEVLDSVKACLAMIAIVDEMKEPSVDSPPQDYFSAVFGFLVETRLQMSKPDMEKMVHRWDVEDLYPDIVQLAKKYDFAPKHFILINYATPGAADAEGNGVVVAEFKAPTAVYAPLLYGQYERTFGKLPDDVASKLPPWVRTAAEPVVKQS